MVPGAARARQSNLPVELTSFVGRRRHLADVKGALSQSRLVSLVGPGGVGKTRLALRVAADLERGLRDGAYFVDLAGLADPQLVPKAVMTAVGLLDQSGQWPTSLLVSHLAQRETLLLLDNCEHLLDATAVLADVLLKNTPAVRLLSTSRQLLGIAGERVINVAPLALPVAEDATSPQRLAQTEAVALLLERARAGGVELEVTPENQETLTELCRRLDGIPLALELAAVRLRTLGLDELLERLTNRFEILTGGSRTAMPRQQTLRATIEWSYDLLSEDERAVLRRLSLFAGAFGLDAVEQTCSSVARAAPDMVNLLSGLVEKSFVSREGSAATARYRLHETMREYGLLELRQAAEEQAAIEAFVDYYAGMCRRAREGAESLHLVEWVAWADREADNIRAALQHCLTSGGFATGISMVGSLSWYWSTRAASEGVRWLDELLAHPEGEPEPMAQALFARGFLATLQIDTEAARASLESAESKACEAHEPTLVVRIQALSAIVRGLEGDLPRARSLVAEALAQAELLDDPNARFAADYASAFTALAEGKLGRAEEVFGQTARTCRERGDLYMLDHSLMNLGLLALLTGRPADARPPLTEALRIARRLDDRVTTYSLLVALGCEAALTGQPRRAARLLGAAEAVRRETGVQSNRLMLPLISQTRERAAAALGGAFDSEEASGRAMARIAAVAYALDESPEPAARAEVRTPLTRRELEIARLIADGLTSQQIAGKLFISERTVTTHVTNILNKLGLSSRIQLAVWVAGAGESAQARAT